MRSNNFVIAALVTLLASSATLSAGVDAACPCGGNLFHSGMDYRANPGTEVPVADNGTVVDAGHDLDKPNQDGVVGACGLYVVVRHVYRNGKAAYTRYTHLGRTVQVGATLKKGQTVGTVGPGGFIHYEIRPNGSEKLVDWSALLPVDPDTFDLEAYARSK